MLDAQRIGSYRLVEPLGQGGMGIVYRARHAVSERPVALKTVKVTSARWLESIRREIQALTRIRHPGVVRILDHGVHHGKPWYAMDLLEGETLRGFCDRIWSPYLRSSPPVGPTEQLSVTAELEPRPTRAPSELLTSSATKGALRPALAGKAALILPIFRRICATLAFLHGEGFVSCDLKPENVLLVDGLPVLIDFGLATRHPSDLSREALENLVAHKAGTLPYMSPEQIRGDLVDARSDLYAVGCMLYELATGSPPFTGNPRELLNQHESSEPLAPSERVSGLPSGLSELILRCLKKSPSERYGFAEELAAELAELIEDAQPLHDFPPPRAYLYRPRFAGRQELLDELAGHLKTAARGRGALVLVGGESGIGKTRLVMEFMRRSTFGQRVITSDASPLSADRSAAAGAAPLHAVRPMLQAIADCCHEHGPEMTERLLGPRHAVLAFYEPVLASLPIAGSLRSVPPLSADAARNRLFEFLAETLTRFSELAPLCWILDDLGWADDLSLSFLASLSADFFASAPLLIVGCYRSEDASRSLAPLLSRPHVLGRSLQRLDRELVGTLAQDMLALPTLPGWFVDSIAEKAEGNPFFLGEYLRAAVSERFVYRASSRAWSFPDSADRPDDAAGQLPRSLRDLLEQRLQRLSYDARGLGLAAAVQGRETDLLLLAQSAGLPERALALALDELTRAQVVESPASGKVRFVHDQLRAVLYAHAPPETLRGLHAKTASALEQRLARLADQSSIWSTLGYHFARAGEPGPSVRYLRLAADHARSAHAHAQAADLYESAVAQARFLSLDPSTSETDARGLTAELQEAMGDMLVMLGKRDAARAAFDEALYVTAPDDNPRGPRLLRKIGKTWEAEHRDPEALRYYRQAQGQLGDTPPLEQGLREEWIQVRLDQLWALYWLNEVDAMNALVGELRPTLAESSTASQRARFFQSLMQLNFRRERYVISEETLELARSSVAAHELAGNALELPLARFGVGFALLWCGSWELARTELYRALSLAERAGDLSLQVRCLAYLGLTARARGDVAELEGHTSKTEALARKIGVKEYIAFALAHKAWLALRAGDFEGSQLEAQRALRIWGELTLVFPFQWLALLPLLGCSLAQGDLQQAVTCIDRLLSTNQQLLPGGAIDALSLARRAWDQGATEQARSLIASAISSLSQTPYH